MLMVTKAKQAKNTSSAKKTVTKKSSSAAQTKKVSAPNVEYQPGKVSFLVAVFAVVSLTLLGIIAVNGA